MNARAGSRSGCALGVDVHITSKLAAVVRGDVTRSRFNAEGSFSDRYLALRAQSRHADSYLQVCDMS